MSRRIDWEKDRQTTQRRIHGVDLAVDAVHNLDAVSAINWDPDGSWWDNRRLLADRCCDVIQNVLVILKHGEQHPAFVQVMVGHTIIIASQDVMSKKRKAMRLEQSRKMYQAELNVLAEDWKRMKMDLSFTYADPVKLAEQRSSFRELLTRTLWQLEEIALLK